MVCTNHVGQLGRMAYSGGGVQSSPVYVSANVRQYMGNESLENVEYAPLPVMKAYNTQTQMRYYPVQQQQPMFMPAKQDVTADVMMEERGQEMPAPVREVTKNEWTETKLAQKLYDVPLSHLVGYVPERGLQKDVRRSKARLDIDKLSQSIRDELAHLDGEAQNDVALHGAVQYHALLVN